MSDRRAYVWTRQPPTEDGSDDGFYWWRPAAEQRAVVVTLAGGRLTEPRSKGEGAPPIRPASATSLPRLLGGQWLGPLLPPGGDCAPDAQEVPTV